MLSDSIAIYVVRLRSRAPREWLPFNSRLRWKCRAHSVDDRKIVPTQPPKQKSNDICYARSTSIEKSFNLRVTVGTAANSWVAFRFTEFWFYVSASFSFVTFIIICDLNYAFTLCRRTSETELPSSTRTTIVFSVMLASAPQWQRDNRKHNFHRHELGMVFTPPPSLRASRARINRNMWSAGARLCCIVSFVLFGFFFFSLLQQRSLQNGKWCLLWSSDTAYHSVLCLAAAVYIFPTLLSIRFRAQCVAPDIFHLSFSSSLVFIFYFALFTSLSLLESRASSPLSLGHHSVQLYVLVISMQCCAIVRLSVSSFLNSDCFADNRQPSDRTFEQAETIANWMLCWTQCGAARERESRENETVK